MPTEKCYRCGRPLWDYFRQLCDECREEIKRLHEKPGKEKESEADG